jgi:hypothetical protein
LIIAYEKLDRLPEPEAPGDLAAMVTARWRANKA